MNVDIIYKGKKTSLSLSDGAVVAEALKKSKINPETVLVRRKDEIILETEKLKDKDNLELLSVVSGG